MQFNTHAHIEAASDGETITYLPSHPLSDTLLRKTKVYRTVFYALSALFLLLGIFTLRASAVELDALTYGYGSSIQSVVSFLALLFSIGSFCVARSLRAEREALRELYRCFKRSLEMHYQAEVAAWKYAFWRSPSDSYREATSLHAEHRRKLIEGTRLYCHARRILDDADGNSLLDARVSEQIRRDTLASLQEALNELV